MIPHTRWLALLTLVTASSPLLAAGTEPNLLKNPGFEDGQTHWTVENTQSNGAPYFYPIDLHGGGHGQALPYSGTHAVEIYSSDRVTRLSQPVHLRAGHYRVAAQASNQGGDGQRLLISVGDQTVAMPVVAMDYRPYFADFTVTAAGTCRVSFVSSSMGMALDDLALTRLPEGETNTPSYLFFNLSPTSPQRSRGVQTYLVGQSQWVNFSISCIAKDRLVNPRLHLYAPQSVAVSGLNTHLLDAWRMPQTTDASVHTAQVIRQGELYHVYSFALPRFVNGPDAPVEFGGFWVEVPSGGVARPLVELEDNGRTFPAQEITLVPIHEPRRQATPQKIVTVAYAVQNWTQSLTNRLATLPRQFAMMGFNVWSDYSLSATNASADRLTAEEQVRLRAFREFGVRKFWPNFSNLFQTEGGGCYANLASHGSDPDMVVVNADGTTNAACYNMRYVAQGGAAWRDSVLAAYQRTLAWPTRAKLPFRYSGFVNDGFEALVFSYDRTTLADFAKTARLDPRDVTIENLNGRLKPRWVSYHMSLYTQCVRNWAAGLRQINPRVITVNTLNTFGPLGSDSLPVPEQMTWAREVDYTMPQWYAMHYYGSLYSDSVSEGVAKKVYGKEDGHADVIPLLNVSMGADLEDPCAIRFKVFDLLSTSPVVKGIGYYIAANAFADGQFMEGLSEVHTLLTDVEDYYADGRKADGLASFIPDQTPVAAISGLNEDGQPVVLKPQITTTVRVHTLNRKGRIALFTVVSHCNQGTGQQGTIRFSRSFLKTYARHPSNLVIIDRLNHAVTPFAAEAQVDTTRTANLALFEVAEKNWARRHISPVP